MKRSNKIVVFSGAGMSAESGINTFRGSGGLWENHRVEDIATPEAFENNPEKVLDFYNQRRATVVNSYPNDAHKAIAKLEEHFDIEVITQNIDDLHERAGSSKVLHLHGEIMKARSSGKDDGILYPVEEEIKIGDLCNNGHQLRPHVVWFGELVPKMTEAIELIQKADYLIIIGTSLNVYPAASLINYKSKQSRGYLIDPNSMNLNKDLNIQHIQAKATEGVKVAVEDIKQSTQ